MKATKKLTADLQAVLVDLIELAGQGKQAHWSIVGHNFRDLHLQLDEIIDAARGFADELAERMRALDAMPDGRFIEKIEQFAWMVSAENRSPRKRG